MILVPWEQHLEGPHLFLPLLMRLHKQFNLSMAICRQRDDKSCLEHIITHELRNFLQSRENMNQEQLHYSSATKLLGRKWRETKIRQWKHMIMSFNSIAIIPAWSGKCYDQDKRQQAKNRAVMKWNTLEAIQTPFYFTRNIFSSLSPSNTNARIQRVLIYLQLLIGNICVFNGGSFIQQSEIFDARYVMITNKTKIEVKAQRIM